MIRGLILVLLLGLWAPDFRAQAPVTTIYLFPGQGADHRQFRDLVFPPEYDTVHITYPVPDKWEDMRSFALRFVQEIDTSSPFILLGVSLGGMICTELADTLPASQVILISSAKCYGELPATYHFQRNYPFNRIIPGFLTKAGALLLQGIVEPDRKYDKDTFKDMLKKKDATYIKRTVDMIVNWERDNYRADIIHIHGDKDNTLPIRNVHYDYLVEDGSHMMVLSRAGDINRILDEILYPKP